MANWPLKINIRRSDRYHVLKYSVNLQISWFLQNPHLTSDHVVFFEADYSIPEEHPKRDSLVLSQRSQGKMKNLKLDVERAENRQYERSTIEILLVKSPIPESFRDSEFHQPHNTNDMAQRTIQWTGCYFPEPDEPRISILWFQLIRIQEEDHEWHHPSRENQSIRSTRPKPYKSNSPGLFTKKYLEKICILFI